MDCLAVTERVQWNQALSALPSPHVLQSWEWGEVKKSQNWTPLGLLWLKGGSPVAAALVLRRPLPHTPWGVMYVPKGPSLDYTKTLLVHTVLGDLERYARRQRAIFCKIDPDVDLPAVEQVLAQRGWRYAAEQIQFRNTALIDLTLPEDALLEAMKSKTRYNVRLAERKQVTIHHGTPADIPLFYEMYAETGARDGFLTRPLAYYRDAWQMFMQAGLAEMLLAAVGSEVVAGLILFRLGQTAWYMYGASTSRHRDKMPNYALQWHAIQWAKAAGCTTYDLWGAPNKLDESDPLWGVWRFKEGLGARFAPHIGAHDYVASPLLYWLYRVALPRYLGRLRRRHDRPSLEQV